MLIRLPECFGNLGFEFGVPRCTFSPLASVSPTAFQMSPNDGKTTWQVLHRRLEFRLLAFEIPLRCSQIANTRIPPRAPTQGLLRHDVRIQLFQAGTMTKELAHMSQVLKVFE